MPTDFELLDAWKAGDSDAGNALFERHFAPVCRFFRNKVDEGVDDLIQRTFLACVESRDRFRAESSFRTYLFTVARNELFAHLRRREREQARFDPLEQSAHDLGPTPTGIVAQHRSQRLLLEALRRIPVDLQVALELFYWEDLPASELARVLQLPEGTVRTRIRRARQLLEAQLHELGENDPDLASTLAGLEDWAKSLRERVNPQP
ncbi:MAG TPA: sigma-70 family RNA polymerase sigma factor [Nannocystaceae bacterium]|nr:sigma-70 family RNA polymerase sigma factor [Nannocystaceae bacterium]